MKITGSRVAYEGKYLRVLNKSYTNEAGESGVWETVERTNVFGSGSVVVVPVTRAHEIIFEKNWRVPSESWVVQFPAGLTDKKGESEEEAARRELLEETGYLAGELVPIITTPLSPDLTPTRATHFLARGVVYKGRKGEISSDEAASEIVKVPLEKVDDFLMDLPTGVGLDLRVTGILWLLEKKGLI